VEINTHELDGAILHNFSLSGSGKELSDFQDDQGRAKEERNFFVEQAIRLIKADWTILAECESPDFIIEEDSYQFGLEVSNIFKGPQTVSGSKTKKRESETQRMLTELQTRYEELVPIQLNVRFVGPIEPETLVPVLQALLDLDLATKPIGFHTVANTQHGLRVHVTRGFRSEWISVMDRVGWVDLNPRQIIADAIKQKSKKLLQYQAAAGSDVRLLLVADGIQNSGKLRLGDDRNFDLHGFNAVYFLRYPEEVTTLWKASKTT
jgi:hypothetical protein